ncbi:MAG: hypothetical protein HPY71_09125 [Firmicutes bacterium]|nr:hypothetical protein [Bacillota bacterium]
MSIRPLDLQNVISKAQEVERIQRVQDEGAKLQQQAFASELQHKADERSQQVTSAPEARGGKIEERRQKGGSKDNGKGGKGSGKASGKAGDKGESEAGGRGVGGRKNPGDIESGVVDGVVVRGSKLDIEV